MAEKDLMLTLEVVCIGVQPPYPIKAPRAISHAMACQSTLSNQKCNRWQRCIIPQLEAFLPHPLKQRKTRLKKILNINGEAAGVCQMVGGVGSFWPLIHETKFAMGPGAVPQPPHKRIMTHIYTLTHIYTSGHKPINILGI